MKRNKNLGSKRLASAVIWYCMIHERDTKRHWFIITTFHFTCENKNNEHKKTHSKSRRNDRQTNNFRIIHLQFHQFKLIHRLTHTHTPAPTRSNYFDDEGNNKTLYILSFIIQLIDCVLFITSLYIVKIIFFGSSGDNHFKWNCSNFNSIVCVWLSALHIVRLHIIVFLFAPELQHRLIHLPMRWPNKKHFMQVHSTIFFLSVDFYFLLLFSVQFKMWGHYR